MSENPHSHAHSPAAHAAARIAPSLLRASAGQRLAGASVLVVLLWLCVYWAIG